MDHSVKIKQTYKELCVTTAYLVHCKTQKIQNFKERLNFLLFHKQIFKIHVALY